MLRPVSAPLALHAPDGFLTAPVALATALFSLAVLAIALRRSQAELGDRQVPLAGMAATFIFAAQMVNFPIVSGTTGHLLGGALAAVLLGPWLGALVVGTVVLVQALMFADGGLTALGYNTLNMAIVTAFGGWVSFLAIRRLMPPSTAGIAAAAGIASGVSVLLSATMFSLQWMVGSTAPVPFSTVFAAMISTHLLIAVGEGVITATVLAAVLAARPDLVHGARHLELTAPESRSPIAFRTFILAGVVAAVFIGAVLSQFSASGPDGLEAVAEETGIHGNPESTPGPLVGWFSDYTTSFVDNETVGLAIAGLSGIAVTLLLSGLVLSIARRFPSSPDAAATHHQGTHHHHLHVPGTSVVHRMAPEVKLAVLVVFVIAVALTPRTALLAFAVDITVVGICAQLAGLSLLVMVRRLAIIVPFVAFAAFIPFVADGEQVTMWAVSVSVDGLWAACNILVKAALGASASIIVSATTTLPDLLRGLRRLRVPAPITAIVAFMFRYIDLVGDQIGRMRTAMVARSHDPRWLWQARPIATSAGALFVRSYERSERVHQAMLARGFSGTMPDIAVGRPGDELVVEPSRVGAVVPAVAAWAALALAVVL